MQIMQVVRNGKSRLGNEAKSAKNVLKFIGGLISAKIIAMDRSKNDV
jgi:hypothetical protein